MGVTRQVIARRSCRRREVRTLYARSCSIEEGVPFFTTYKRRRSPTSAPPSRRLFLRSLSGGDCFGLEGQPAMAGETFRVNLRCMFGRRATTTRRPIGEQVSSRGGSRRSQRTPKTCTELRIGSGTLRPPDHLDSDVRQKGIRRPRPSDRSSWNSRTGHSDTCQLEVRPEHRRSSRYS